MRRSAAPLRLLTPPPRRTVCPSRSSERGCSLGCGLAAAQVLLDELARRAPLDHNLLMALRQSHPTDSAEHIEALKRLSAWYPGDLEVLRDQLTQLEQRQDWARTCPMRAQPRLSLRRPGPPAVLTLPRAVGGKVSKASAAPSAHASSNLAAADTAPARGAHAARRAGRRCRRGGRRPGLSSDSTQAWTGSLRRRSSAG